jgi:hypothetical protein
MKTPLIIPLVISFLIGCATTQKEQYDEYENSIHIGNKIIRINKDFKYVGNLSTTIEKEYLDGPTGSSKMVSGEHFFINVNPNDKIDKVIIVYSYTLKKPGDYWRGEVNYKNSKKYQSHMHLGNIEINNSKCACVVKKWPYVGERYVKFVKEKGYEFDRSKHCIIETKIGKTISRSTIIHVSYLEGIDSCQSIRNVEKENTKIVQKMFSKLQSNVNIKW